MVIFDTETTGLVGPITLPLHKQPHIIEFAAVKLDPETLEEVDVLNFLINPGFQISAEITKITGITNAMLKDQLPMEAQFKTIQDFLFAVRTLVGHNLDFDTNLLAFAAARLGKQYALPWPPHRICTVEATQFICGRRMKLGDVYTHATGLKIEGAHRAINDVRATADVVRWLRSEGKLPGYSKPTASKGGKRK